MKNGSTTCDARDQEHADKPGTELASRFVRAEGLQRPFPYTRGEGDERGQQAKAGMVYLRKR